MTELELEIAVHEAGHAVIARVLGLEGGAATLVADESGRAQVYVEPFPRVDGNSPRWQISTGGGGQPKWRGDGKELFYMMRNGKMMAATVTAGAKFTASEPHLLFPTRALPHDVNMYDVTRDGRRFLVNTPLEWSTSSPITVVANWTEGFKKE